ncbi:MAG TPA: SMI1/KNR4 family protein [Abditibacterium sp.]|jgi:hypothetical protein
MSPLFEKLEKMGLKTSGDPNERLPITRADVESLEAFFGYPFPPLYAEFAEHFAKCRFDFGDEDAYAFCKLPDDWVERAQYDERLSISDFYGLDLDIEGTPSGFRAIIDTYRGSGFPDCFLPLYDNNGDDPMSLFLCCGEENYGGVYAFPVSYVYAVENGTSQTEAVAECAILIADSFEQFLEGIEVVPSDDGPQELSPLFAAFHAGDVAYLQRMVDAGEIFTYGNRHLMTLLQCAVNSGLEWPVELLLKNGAPVEEAIAWATVSPGPARAFIAHGVHPNQPFYINRKYSNDWSNALISSVRGKRYDMVRFFISAGADATLPDSDGKTAWDYVHPRNQVMRDILKESIPVPAEERAKYILPAKSETSL